MSKQKILTAAFLSLIIVIMVITIIIIKKPLPNPNPPPSVSNQQPLFQSSKVQSVQTKTNSQTTSRRSAAASGRQTYSIMAAHRSPNFTKAIIDPEDVKLDQKQTMTVYVSDDKASIVEVIAEIETDKGKIKEPLKLKSGTDRDGIWEGSWIVKDTHDTTYVTVFKAKNNLGETGEARLSWTDPGCGCTGTACTISASCTISGVDGADGGTFEIHTILGGGVTIAAGGTLIAGALYYWGSYGVLVKNDDTGVVNINSTNTICMTDADSDNYPANTTQIANCTSGRRRYLMSSITTTDCYDSNANARPGQTNWFTTQRGDSSFDYNCVNGQEKQYNSMGVNDCCCDGESCGFSGTTGWDSQVVGSPPACGVQTNYVDGGGCHIAGGSEDPYCSGSPTPLWYQGCH